MHELSIVTYVVKQVQEIAEENNLTEIESVTLEFGEVSGIVPEYLEDCWNWYTKKEPIIQGTKFLYEIIPAVTWCDDCKQTYPTVQYGKTCRIAAAARPGCSRAMRSISSRSRRADRAGPSACGQQRYTKAVAQPLLIETQMKRE